MIARGIRDRRLTDVLGASALEAVSLGPWRRLESGPAWDIVKRLSGTTGLHGAQLWHLATTLTLRVQVPELRLLTFDERLREAAAASGLAA